MMTFHEWKDLQKFKDGGLIHPREWYWQAYGDYCNRVRNREGIILLPKQPAPGTPTLVKYKRLT